MTNKDILEKLMLRANEVKFDARIEEGYSVNAEMFRRHMPFWNNKDEFPLAELKKYVRMNEWSKEDFSFENEKLIKEFLPDCVHDMFYDVKEFRANSRTELLSTQSTYARIYGYPTETQDEKAFVVYNYAYDFYYERSLIHGNKEVTNEGE